jgi:similar to stage IV sporulation protein
VIMRKIWAYFFGYLVLVVKGTHPERFINLAFTRGVYLWDLTWTSPDTLIVKVYAHTFRTLRHLARQSGCRVRIRKKRGFPFLVNRFRRRRMLFVGGFVFLFLLYLLSSFIYTVEVEGTDQISPDKIERLAAEQGLRPGSLRYQVDRDQVVNYLLRELPEISYAEVHVSPRSRIRIVEKVSPPKSIGTCHIVAKKDGIIDSMLALTGQPVVKEGDLVKKGQILISGEIYPPEPEPDPNNQNPQPPTPRKPVDFVQAQGVVYARTWYRFYGEAPRNEVIEEETNRTVKIYCIKLGDKEITIHGPSQIPYKFFRAKTTRSKFPQWRNLNLPVEFVTIEAKEIKRARLQRTFEEAKELAAGRARDQAVKGLPDKAEPVSRQYKVIGSKDDNPVRVLLTVETREEIGITQPFQAKEKSSQKS